MLGNQKVSMGSWFSSQISDLASEIIGDSVNVLKRMIAQDDSGSDMFSASLVYLQRDDIVLQTRNIFEELNIVEVHGGFKSILGCCFLEILAISKSNDKYVLNFWPCSDCACIAVSEPNTEEAIAFETHINTSNNISEQTQPTYTTITLK